MIRPNDERKSEMLRQLNRGLRPCNDKVVYYDDDDENRNVYVVDEGKKLGLFTKLDKLTQKKLVASNLSQNKKNSPPTRTLEANPTRSICSSSHWYTNRTQVSIKADRQIKEYFYPRIRDIDYPMRLNYCWDFSPTHGQFVRSWAIAQRTRLQELRANFNNLEEVKTFRELVARRREQLTTRRHRHHSNCHYQPQSQPQSNLRPDFLVVLY